MISLHCKAVITTALSNMTN